MRGAFRWTPKDFEDHRLVVARYVETAPSAAHRAGTATLSPGEWLWGARVYCRHSEAARDESERPSNVGWCECRAPGGPCTGFVDGEDLLCPACRVICGHGSAPHSSEPSR